MSIEGKGHWTVYVWPVVTALWLLVRVAGATRNGCLSGRMQGIVPIGTVHQEDTYFRVQKV